MMFYEMSNGKLEELYNTDIRELGFSVRAYNLLKRAGYDSLGELACMTVEELENICPVGKRAHAEVLDKLTERGICLPTQEEKQRLLASTDQADVLRTEISRLEKKCEKNQASLGRLRQEQKEEYAKRQEAVNKERDMALKEARGIVSTSPYPIARILESMYFGQSAYEGCSFCKIFGLWERGCLLEQREDVEHSCEECIDQFLAEYYSRKEAAK
ncbi:MAG: DNA-directed RNA polymerase subunit alpha C-terminal domain-containing protein [Roseburia sp.]